MSNCLLDVVNGGLFHDKILRLYILSHIMLVASKTSILRLNRTPYLNYRNYCLQSYCRHECTLKQKCCSLTPSLFIEVYYQVRKKSGHVDVGGTDLGSVYAILLLELGTGPTLCYFVFLILSIIQLRRV